ncbi:MAG: hypothetical protein LH491_01110 [Pseudoxanthomonas sp.]|nr:hypothetical protein [Pseudoxanthomonas sp.]
MTPKEAAAQALERGAAGSRTELAANPTAATGSCTISSAGWSECKNDFTKAQCDAQAGPGFTVTWVENGKC